MNYKHITGPKQPSIFTHTGRYMELPHTTPAVNNSITREAVSHMSPLRGAVYALAAIADNLAALTDMISLRGEEIHTELSQLSENAMNTHADTEGRD